MVKIVILETTFLTISVFSVMIDLYMCSSSDYPVCSQPRLVSESDQMQFTYTNSVSSSFNVQTTWLYCILNYTMTLIDLLLAGVIGKSQVLP